MNAWPNPRRVAPVREHSVPCRRNPPLAAALQLVQRHGTNMPEARRENPRKTADLCISPASPVGDANFSRDYAAAVDAVSQIHHKDVPGRRRILRGQGTWARYKVFARVAAAIAEIHRAFRLGGAGSEAARESRSPPEYLPPYNIAI